MSGIVILMNFLYFLPFLAVYGAIIFGFAVGLSKLGIPRRRVIFASCTLFGILSGFVLALYGHYEGGYVFNILGSPLGEEIYGFSIRHIGDPHSAFAHYTIPWALRIPQVRLFASAIAWGLIGALAQLIYNRAKKPPVTKGLSTQIIAISLVACLVICTGVVYGTQKAHAKPLEPVAVPVVEIGTPPEVEPGTPGIPQWDTITTYEVEQLYLSDRTILTGRELLVTGIVENTGLERGIAEVELSLDGVVLSSQEVALLPGESKPVRFSVSVPREGIYIVGMGNLTASFEAKKPAKKVTEEENRRIATNYLLNSPTFKFDGIEGSIRLIAPQALKYNDAWQFIYKFRCAHPGYGDRSGEMLAQAVTPHTARIIVRRGEVTFAVIDEKWDIRGQRVIWED